MLPPPHYRKTLYGTALLLLAYLIALGTLSVLLLSSCDGRKYLLESPQPTPQPTIPAADPPRGYQMDSDSVAQAVADMPDFTPISDTLTLYVQFQFVNMPEVLDWGRVYHMMDSSLAVANQAFKGFFKLERDPILYSFNTEVDIYTLYDNFKYEPLWYDDWVDGRAVDSSLTIFVLPTYERDRSYLLGFCPVLTYGFDYYLRAAEDVDNANKFNHLFVTYRGLAGGNTLAHEVGHWAGMRHPWEMDSTALLTEQLQLQVSRLRNRMSYRGTQEEFTDGQLNQAWKFITKYRMPYLRYASNWRN